MNDPKISVVFTSYNHKEYLKQAIDSLLTQTFRDFELIIVDDCSTDGSQEILREYAKIDERVRLTINKKNSGSYVYSTNQGASMAVAPYIIFAQCDDYAESTQLEKLYDAITNNKVAVAFCRSNLVSEYGEILGTDFDSRDSYFKTNYAEGGLISNRYAFNSLLHSCMIPNLSAAIILRSEFERLNGLSDNYIVLADWDFWIRMSEQCNFFYISESLNNFRQHHNTIRSKIKTTRQIKEMIYLYKSAVNLKPNYRNKIYSCAAFNCIISAYENKKHWISSLTVIYLEGFKITCLWPLYLCFGFINIVKLFINSKIHKI